MSGTEIWRVNAFTTTPFTGNPAGVVPCAEGLDDARMQAIANEINDLSETAFVLPPTEDGADLKLRYFTSTTEVDLCGHATIAALFTLHWRGDLQADPEAPDGRRTVRAETRVGTLELGLEFHGGKLDWATMEQLEPSFAEAPGADRAAEVLGLPPTAIAPHPQVGCCHTGIWVCYVPLDGLESLARVKIHRSRIEALWPDNPELAGVYAFAFTGDRNTRGRFFSPPKFGIVEDPVTGTASAGLGAWLMEHDLLDRDAELIARQGVEMGRAGEVRVRRNANGRMGISGRAVAVIRGTVLD